MKTPATLLLMLLCWPWLLVSACDSAEKKQARLAQDQARQEAVIAKDRARHQEHLTEMRILLKEQLDGIRVFADRVKTLPAHLPAPEKRKARRCPRKASNGQSEVLRIDAPTLQLAADGLALPQSLAAYPLAGTDGWHVLRSSDLLPMVWPDLALRPKIVNQSLRLSKQTGFVAVFDSQQRKLPKLSAGGKAFESGYFVGWVHLFDARTSRLVCAEPIKFLSSLTLDLDAEGQKKIQADFDKQAQAELQRASLRLGQRVFPVDGKH